MLNQISPAKSAHAEDAVDLLTGCHDRIRHFTGIAVKLAHAHAASPDEITQAAAAVHRYYSVSLPLHEADEDLSMRPRLDQLGDEHVRHALIAMGDQHAAIDELLERLLPLLELVRNNPAAIGAAGAEMCQITKALEDIFQAHLQMEEQVIFPVIRQGLSQAARAELLREMQQRRQPGR